MGLRHKIRRSTLADANESRDWCIWSDFAALLIRRARKLYSNCDFGLDLSNAVYALDSTNPQTKAQAQLVELECAHNKILYGLLSVVEGIKRKRKMLGNHLRRLR